MLSVSLEERYFTKMVAQMGSKASVAKQMQFSFKTEPMALSDFFFPLFVNFSRGVFVGQTPQAHPAPFRPAWHAVRCQQAVPVHVRR